jgi:hypothetical protein
MAAHWDAASDVAGVPGSRVTRVRPVARRWVSRPAGARSSFRSAILSRSNRRRTSGIYAVAFWWVNHKQTFRHEFRGGYIWSPKRRRDGTRNAFYDFMQMQAQDGGGPAK